MRRTIEWRARVEWLVAEMPHALGLVARVHPWRQDGTDAVEQPIEIAVAGLNRILATGATFDEHGCDVLATAARDVLLALEHRERRRLGCPMEWREAG